MVQATIVNRPTIAKIASYDHFDDIVSLAVFIWINYVAQWEDKNETTRKDRILLGGQFRSLWREVPSN